MGIYRCIECEQMRDDDHDPCQEFGEGLICPSCAEVSNQEIECPHCFNTFMSAAPDGVLVDRETLEAIIAAHKQSTVDWNAMRRLEKCLSTEDKG